MILIEYYDTTLGEICIKTRKREILRMRQIVQTTLARWSKMSLQEIGILTGNRDHATVLNSKNRIENAEYLYKKYHTNSTLLTDYLRFELRYKQFLESQAVKVERGFRSYKEEQRCTR